MIYKDTAPAPADPRETEAPNVILAKVEIVRGPDLPDGYSLITLTGKPESGFVLHYRGPREDVRLLFEIGLASMQQVCNQPEDLEPEPEAPTA
jgi:hypothetical protein